MNETTLKSYSKEEEYFYKQNKELIEKMRQRKNLETASTKPTHFMKCPKCTGELSEIELAGIRVDQCGECRGIYFDPGELEILMESKEPKGFLGAMKRLFN